MPPQNRKQRRAAAAAAAATATDSFDPSSIPLARPPETKRDEGQAKTLFEIAAERQEEFEQLMGEHKTKNSKSGTTKTSNKKTGNDNKNNKTAPSLFDLDTTQTQLLEISPSGEVSSLDPSRAATAASEEEDEDVALPPIIDTLFLSFALTAVHFTLSFLAAHQYMQEINYRNLLKESSFIAFPVLSFAIHLAHGHIISLPFLSSKHKKSKSNKSSPSSSSISSILLHALIGDLDIAKTVFYLPLAIILGGLLVHTTNEAGYYAVMKRTPSIGTMWVWCVLEISSPLAALLAVLVPLTWGAVVMGYAIY